MAHLDIKNTRKKLKTLLVIPRIPVQDIKEHYYHIITS